MGDAYSSVIVYNLNCRCGDNC